MTTSDPAEHLLKRRKPDVLPNITVPEGEEQVGPLVLYQSLTDPEDVIQVPAAINRHLRPYQRQGVKFLFKRCFGDASTDGGKGAILADDMGLGKTVQVIALLSALLNKTQIVSKDRDQCRRVQFGPELPKRVFLIIAPSSVMFNWEDELNVWGTFAVEKFHGSDRDRTLNLARFGKLEVVLTTFEMARTRMEDLNLVKWDAVIVDEVHRIKEAKSQVTQALKRLGCKCRIGLTGTLVQNKYDELWCILDWANPRCLRSLQSFSQAFSSRIERGLRITATKGELATARQLQKELDELKLEWVLRRTKSKTIAEQLPKKTDQIVFCQPSAFQIKVFQALRESEDMEFILSALKTCDCGSGKKGYVCCNRTNAEGQGWKQVVFTFMHLFLKTANHVALLHPSSTGSDNQADQGRKYCKIVFEKCGSFYNNSFLALSDPKFSGKMLVLVQLLEILREEESKVLLFSYSTSVLSILESFVQSKGYDYRRLDGQTKSETRLGIVRDFNSNPDIFIFLISTKAGGLGLNITGANVVIIFDPNWNPSHDLQAQDRAYRIGQTRDVRVYRLVTAGSIEENIYLRQVYKQQLGRNAVDGENARRYFEAVQGQAKGELFGIKNMFAISEGGECLTSRIMKRNDSVEQLVRGNRRIDVRGNMMEYDDSGEEATSAVPNSNSSSVGGIRDQDLDDLILDDLERVEKQANSSVIDRYVKKHKTTAGRSIDSVLRSEDVVFCHANQDLLGGSRVEDHISKCALKSVAKDELESDDPVLHNCELIPDTQTLDVTSPADNETDDAIPLTQMSKRTDISKHEVAILVSDGERIHRTENCCYLYGQTPTFRKEADFERLASYLGEVSLEAAAEHVLSISARERADLLRGFYASLNYEEVDLLYDEVIGEIDREEQELRDFDLELTRGSSDAKLESRKASSADKTRVSESSDNDDDSQGRNATAAVGETRNDKKRRYGRNLKYKQLSVSSPKRSRLAVDSVEADDDIPDVEKHRRPPPPKPAPPDLYQSQTSCSRSFHCRPDVDDLVTAGPRPKVARRHSPKPAPEDVFRPRLSLDENDHGTKSARPENSSDQFYRSLLDGEWPEKISCSASSSAAVTLEEDSDVSFLSQYCQSRSLTSNPSSSEAPDRHEATSRSGGGAWSRLLAQGKIKPKDT